VRSPTCTRSLLPPCRVKSTRDCLCDDATGSTDDTARISQAGPNEKSQSPAGQQVVRALHFLSMLSRDGSRHIAASLSDSNLLLTNFNVLHQPQRGCLGLFWAADGVNTLAARCAASTAREVGQVQPDPRSKPILSKLADGSNTPPSSLLCSRRHMTGRACVRPSHPVRGDFRSGCSNMETLDSNGGGSRAPTWPQVALGDPSPIHAMTTIVTKWTAPSCQRHQPKQPTCSEIHLVS
jgi:hypothetical protein